MNSASLKKIEEYLLAKSLVEVNAWQQAKEEAASTKKDIEKILAEKNIFDPVAFARIKSEVFNLPFADLSEYTVGVKVLNLLTAKIAQNYQMVVFEQKGSKISVGLVDPGDFHAHEAVDFMAQQKELQPSYFVISLASFEEVFKMYDQEEAELGSALANAKEKFLTKQEIDEVSEDSGDLDRVVKSAPVAKIVSVIIKNAVDGGASDIHIEPGRTEARVRYRMDGILHTSLTIPTFLHNAVVSRIKVLANLKLDETRIPQDGRIRVDVDGQDVDLRVSVLPMLDAEKVVMRVLDTSAGVPTLAELGFFPEDIAIIERNIKKPHGLVLLTGPTGSGKTTTLYSILNMLNGDNCNITTLEDPIEYYINGINQSQIRADIDFTFAKGLRAILRQDPNIVMVGEIRDNETAELVIHAALTGHLVFSTLHTNDAIGAIPRLMDMKVEPFLLSSTLNLVMAQRLVRKICQSCKQEIKLPDNLQKSIDEDLKGMPAERMKQFGGKLVFYTSKGCAECNETGYVGRTVLSEIIEVDQELRDLVSKGFDNVVISDKLKEKNHVSLFQDGVLKALSGLTTIEEVLRVARE